jgi:hypothetical protein
MAIFGAFSAPSSGPCLIKFQRSSLQNVSFLFFMFYWGIETNLTFEDSTLNNILLDGTGSRDRWQHIGYNSYQANVLIRNSIFTLGNISLGLQSNSLNIRNSTLTEVNLYSQGDGYPNSYYRTTVMMFKTNFQKGGIKMPYASVMISQSTVSLLSLPLDMGSRSTISCSSIVRSPLIPQTNTTGISATDLRLINSSVSRFHIGLRVNPTYVNTVSISNSNLESNTLYNIVNVGPYDIIATGNWWGTTNLQTIKAKINDYWQNIYIGEVLFGNYSSSRLLAERSCSL